MKPKSTLIGATNPMTPSKWIQAALMTLALFAAALVVSGCDRSDDSDHHMNHGNQNHPTGGNR